VGSADKVFHASIGIIGGILLTGIPLKINNDHLTKQHNKIVLAERQKTEAEEQLQQDKIQLQKDQQINSMPMEWQNLNQYILTSN